MAVVAIKSKAITNRDASPKVINDAAYAKGALKSFVGQCAVTSGNDIASKYFFGQIPSNAIVHSLLVSSSADAGTTTTGHLGLWKKTADDGTAGVVVDADFFKATLLLNGGALTDAEHANGNVITLALSEKKIWELLGLSSDPNLIYDVILQLDAACDGTAVVQVKCIYAE